MTPNQNTSLEILNKNEWVNIPYLQRKMKISYEESKYLCMWLSTCYNVGYNDTRSKIFLTENE